MINDVHDLKIAFDEFDPGTKIEVRTSEYDESLGKFIFHRFDIIEAILEDGIIVIYLGNDKLSFDSPSTGA